MELPINKTNKSQDIIWIFLIVLVALLYRRYDAFANPQLWAEDGKIFLQQYEDYRFMSLFKPYAGYLHLIPRLIAFIFGALSINLIYIPVCYNLSAFFITLFIAYYLWKSATFLNLKNKVLYATIFLLLPMGAEMFMNITNIIWFTSLFLLNFIFVGYHYGNKYINSVLVLLFSLTGPFSLLLSPIIVLIIIIERKKLKIQELIPFIIILFCGLIQLILIKYNGGINRGSGGEPEHFHLFKLIINNISDLMFLNSGLLSEISASVKIVLCIIFLSAFLYLIIICYRRITIERKYVLVLAAIIFLGSFIAAFWPYESGITSFVCPRYYFIPYTCIGWIFIISFDKKIKPIFIGIYIAFFLLHFRKEISVLPDKQWEKQIIEYYEGKTTEISINPDGWNITLPKRK